MIAKPVGIRTVVTGIPFYTGHDGSSPVRYFRLGRFTLGNTHGFYPSHGLEYAQQLLYPIPAVWELLAYDIRDGASCLFEELVDVPDLTAKQPWDRTPTAWSLNGSAYLTVGGALITTATYTVPAGRRLRVDTITLSLNCLGAAGTLGYGEMEIQRNGVLFTSLFMWRSTVGDHEHLAPLGGPMYFSPGEVISIHSRDQHAAGSYYGTALMSGFLFDA